MTLFRLMLAAMLAILSAYTGVVIANHGMDLFSVFFGDMAAMGWPGQFDLDFMFMLILSASWVTWRHNYSLPGLALGVLAAFGGTVFLTVYLLVISFQAQGDMREILLGRARASGALS